MLDYTLISELLDTRHSMTPELKNKIIQDIQFTIKLGGQLQINESTGFVQCTDLPITTEHTYHLSPKNIEKVWVSLGYLTHVEGVLYIASIDNPQLALLHYPDVEHLIRYDLYNTLTPLERARYINISWLHLPELLSYKPTNTTSIGNNWFDWLSIAHQNGIEYHGDTESVFTYWLITRSPRLQQWVQDTCPVQVAFSGHIAEVEVRVFD